MVKSYFFNVYLECYYILILYIYLYLKDWVGIFKVGWSIVCDYYMFLWFFMFEYYVEGLIVNCVLVF